MKAYICTKYGPPEVLQLKEVPKPVPEDNEVLIKVIAATVHIGDTKIRRLEPGLGAVNDFFYKPLMRIVLGFKGPRKKILGMELAGDIVAVGKSVTKFKTGDSVFASTEFRLSAHAEYCCLSENATIAIKPANMSYEEAAPVSNAALTVYNNFKKVNIQSGHKVLVYGASGSVGTYAVQLAKYYGAEVTGVCSTANMEMVKSLGADEVIDYTKEDFTLRSETYDVIYDAVGKIEYSKRKKSLNKTGVYLSVLAINGNIKLKAEDLNYIKELCEAGHLRTVIDKCYSFEQMIEAHRYVDKGHKKGNVVITLY